MKTIQSIIELATEFLKKHQVARPRLAAEILLSHFLDLKRIDLYMQFDRPLIEEELELFRNALKRKIKGEPLEYILETIEFFDCKIKVSSACLIPRQETEILLDKVSSTITNEKTALDLCSGSGCLGIGLKKAHPNLDVFCVDISAEAISLAQENAKNNQLTISCVQGDLVEPVKDKRFDLILCNPPYISEKEYKTLDLSVKNFEPKLALVSGESGYEFFERLSVELLDILNPGGKVFFEIGTGQGKKILEIFSNPKWQNLRVEQDWAGHDRFFSASYFP